MPLKSNKSFQAQLELVAPTSRAGLVRMGLGALLMVVGLGALQVLIGA